jgi:glutathione peroxidase
MNQSIYEIEVTDASGKKTKLSDYKGKVLLIVNVASKCGFTPQYEQLQKIYEKYQPKGLEILAFPSNDFAQELTNDNSIQQFCMVNYGVTFKVFSKGKVKGKNAQPLYHFLATNSKRFFVSNYPFWNFQKFLIDKNGKVADWFTPWTRPDSDKITEAIEKCLNTVVVENKK